MMGILHVRQLFVYTTLTLINMTSTIRITILTAALAAGLGSTSALGQSGDYIIWDGETDNDWTTATNWDGNGAAPDDTLPSIDFTTFINDGTPVLNSLTEQKIANLTLTFSSGQVATLDIQSDLSLVDDVTDPLNPVYYDLVIRSAAGTVNHSAGTVTANEVDLGERGSTGIYNITGAGAVLDVNTLNLGRGDATTLFNQTNGLVDVTNNLLIQNAQDTPDNIRTYRISGGTLLVGNNINFGARSASAFEQTGGVVDVQGDLNLGTSDDAFDDSTFSISGESTATFGGNLLIGSDENDRSLGRGTVVLDGSTTNGTFEATGFELRNTPPDNLTAPPSVLQAIVDQDAVDGLADMFFIDIDGDVLFEDGSLLFPEFDSGVAPTDGTWTIMTWTGSVTDNGLTLDGATIPGWSFLVDDINNELSITYVVPEPTSTSLAALAGAALLAFRRRRA